MNIKYIIIGLSLLCLIALLYCKYFMNNNNKYDVQVIEDVLTPDECEQLINYHRDKLAESTVIGKTGFDKSEDRTSSQAWLFKNNTDLQHIINKLFKTISEYVQINEHDQFEDIQVACYKQSQQYKHHYDACISEKYCPSEHKIYRKATLLVYLNDDFTGGETEFPLINKKIQPKKGSAAFFLNTNDENTEIHESLHGGLPVNEGEKWIANVWLKFK